MITAIRKNMEKRDEGFTLIELLVVVIIIGILAAIAIPTFLNQRRRGWQAELTSAVRNASLEVEAQATSLGGVYPATVTVDATAGTINPSPAVVTLTYAPHVTAGVNTGFCLRGVHTSITGAHGQRYLSGSAVAAGGGTQSGLQPYNDTTAQTCP